LNKVWVRFSLREFLIKSWSLNLANMGLILKLRMSTITSSSWLYAKLIVWVTTQENWLLPELQCKLEWVVWMIKAFKLAVQHPKLIINCHDNLKTLTYPLTRHKLVHEVKDQWQREENKLRLLDKSVQPTCSPTCLNNLFLGSLVTATQCIFSLKYPFVFDRI